MNAPLPSPDLAGTERLIDWGLATSIARRIAGRDPFNDSYLASSLTSDFTAVTEEAAGLVAEYTRLPLTGSAAGIVLSRHEWVETNVRSVQRLVAPLAERMPPRLGPLAVVPRSIGGTESGVLLGIMAQRVLGQYDLFFAEHAGGDAVFYVGGNILTVEKRYAFRPRDFRMWIALHEVTHWAQFTGVPWLRGYFLEQVDAILRNLSTDPMQFVRALRASVDRVRTLRNPIGEAGLMSLIATEEQRAALDRMQALMSLLEGHGNAVMNALGATHVAGQERMAATLAARRNPRGLAGLFQRLIGLDAKMRQYDTGERFIQQVEAEAGPQGLDPVWRGPEYLPTLDELSDPLAWLARVDVVAAPSDDR